MNLFAIFIVGAVFLATFLLWAIYKSGKKKEMLSFPAALISLIIGLIYFVAWEEQTDENHYHPVDRDKCEWTKSSTTLYLECGDRKFSTENRYIYEHIEDSTKVRVAIKEQRDVFGTDYKTLKVKKK